MATAKNSPTVRSIPSLIIICLVSFPAYAKYSGGTGEPNDPYQIATTADLIALGETPEDYDKHFILTADIDLSPGLPGRKTFSKAVIAPTLSWAGGTSFTGVFDGSGHTISHVHVTVASPGGYVGLFGELGSGGEAKDLGIADVHITGSGDQGVGGLVGWNSGTVTRCYSTGSLQVPMMGRVGGLIGCNQGTVTDCYSSAAVTGFWEIGGLVGANDATVTRCYSTGPVQGTDGAGGLTGYRSYSNNGTVTACFWDTQTSGQTTSGGGTGKTTAQMRTAATFAAWDFQSTWRIQEGVDYPRLKWEPNPNAVATTLEKVSGDNQQAMAGSKLPSPLTVRVKDQNRQVMAGAQVTFAFAVGSGALQPPVAVTNASGIASTTVTLGPTAGPAKVRATVGSLSVEFSMEALAAPTPTTLEKASGDNQQAMAGSKLPSPLTVRVKDQNRQVMAGVQVTFAFAVGSGALQPPVAVTNASGIASTTVTLGPTAGPAKVRATVGSLSVEFSMEATPARTPTALEKVSGDSQQAMVGSRLASPLTVRVKDQNRQVMAGAQVTFAFAVGSGALQPPVAVTNASGIASTTVTLGPTAGPAKVRATVGSLSVEFSMEALAAPVATSLEKVSGDSQQAMVGSRLPLALTVRVKDQNRQVMTGAQVTFAFVLASGTLAPPSAMTDASGIASTTVTLGPTAGPAKVRATAGSASVDFNITVLPLAYTGGTGTSNDPYQISTPAGLLALADTPDHYGKHFILTADIDLDPNLPGGRMFDKAVIAPDTGTGTWPFKGTPFTGVFDGNGHTISHLTIRGSYWVGLFGQTATGAQVKRLGILDVNINGSGMYIGGLVGVNYGTVTWCCSIGAVTGSTRIGGLAGYNQGDVSYSYTGGTVTCTGESAGGLASSNGGTITCCCSTCVVKGTAYIGGLLGTNSGTVASCYNEGSVSGDGAVGGLMGWVSKGAVVFSSYNRGAVTADHQVGGLVGTNEGLVTMCYSTGKVTGVWWPGGLIGTDPSPGATTLSFWDMETSGRFSSSGGMGRTTAQMKSASTFLNAGWDFVGETDNGTEDTWRIDEGKDYPRLSCEVPQVKYGGGTGTEADPYQIRTVAHLNAIGACASDWTKHFKLMADLDMSGYDGKAGRPAFNLIGPDTDPATWYYDQYAVPFTGVFDGNGHTISHLTITGRDYLGLFCYIEGAEVRDLGVVDVNITGTARAVGGLVGYTRASHVIRCYSTGVVKGGYCVGGLAGYNIGYMTHCFSKAQVRGTGVSVGGLAGESWGPVTDCYSTGAVNGSQDVGGLVGGNYGSVTKCYSAGLVNGSSDVGGLVGISGGMLGEDNVTNSFWDTQTTGQDTSSGGIGKTTMEMQAANTFLEAGWDFEGETANGTEDMWWIREGQDYPGLSWEAHSN